MNARIVTGAVCAAGFALVIVTMPRERAPERAPAPTTARRARPPRPQARPARQPAASPSTKPPEAVTALPVALDAGAAANDRASALDSIDPAALGEGDVRRLALLASTPGLDEDVRAAALSLLLAVAEDGSRAARLRALAFFLGEAPDESTEPRLGALLADGDAEVRKGAADALGSASPASRDAALLALERAFPAETDDGVQEAMAAAIVRAGRERAPAVLERLARNASPQAAQVLARHHEGAAPKPPEPAPAPPTSEDE